MDCLDWVPWGRARLTPAGVETAFHHPLIAIRVNGDARVRVVKPGDIVFRPTELIIESWRPMAWAKAGRRGWQTLGKLGPHTAFWGEDGHLFHTNNAVCEQLFEDDVLGEEGTSLWQSLLRHRVEWCNKHNMLYRHLVIPEHHAVYSDAIPDRPSLSHRRPLIRIMSGLEAHVRMAIVYPLDRMIAGRDKFDTSLRHDVHFTGYGCFLCYQMLVETFDGIAISDYIQEKDLSEREIFVAGDVAHAAGVPGQRVKFHEPPKARSQHLVKGTSFKMNQVDVYTSDSRSNQTLVMFRTSNSSHLIPYLLHHFSRITAVGSTNVLYDLLESERPNCVIAEMPERYFAAAQASPESTICRLVPADGLSFEKETGLSLPLPTK